MTEMARWLLYEVGTLCDYKPLFDGKTVIGYGIGFFYKATSEFIREIVDIDYLCDATWDDTFLNSYDGLPIVRREELDDIPNKVFIIFTCNVPLIKVLSKEFEEKGYDYCLAMDLLGRKSLSGTEIKKGGCNGTLEIGTNIINYDESLPDNINIRFLGWKSRIEIGRDLLIDSLDLYVGSNCKCSIGKNVRVVHSKIDIAGADLIIGDDCLISYDTEIRSHDSHMIFDKNTKERINYPKETIIGPQVWIAAGAKILPGANIGSGSIVAANAVTSSTFGKNVLIAGNPARVIRESIIWSKDNTAFANWEIYDDCFSKDAEKYF